MQATDQRPHTPPTEPTWQTTFLSWLPSIEKQLSFAFRHLDHEAREEHVQEAIANCCVQYERLFKQGRASVASPTSLARFAVRPGSRWPDGGDECQRPRSALHSTLNAANRSQWNVSTTATSKRMSGCPSLSTITVSPWPIRQLCGSTSRSGSRALLAGLQEIACDLARGFSTSEVAARYGVSAGRVSQLRREFYLSWLAFQGLMPVSSAGCRGLT